MIMENRENNLQRTGILGLEGCKNLLKPIEYR